MEIRENAIWEMEIVGDFFGVKPLEELEEALKGVPYEEGAVKAALEQANLKEYMAGISVDEMLTAMF
jgi:lipoate-protein ligase A